MATGGKAYGSRSSQDRLRASTAQATISEISETNSGSLLLNLVAKRSTCDNPSKCILDTLKSRHVKTGDTSEKRIAIIKTTIHQGICCQDSSIICQILSHRPEITNTTDMISKGRIVFLLSLMV